MRGLLKTYQLHSQHQENKLGSNEDSLRLANMHNDNQPLKRQGSQDAFQEQDKPKTKEEIQMARVKERQRLRVTKAANRREHWVSLNANDPDFIQGFQQGSLPMVHADLLKFRDFSAPGREGLQGSVIKSSVEHSLLKKIPTYDHADYNDKQPNNHNNFRPRNFTKETTSPIVKQRHMDEKERILEKIHNMTPKLTTEPLNTLLLIKPKWREHDESKWVGGKEFQSQNSKKDRAWQLTKNTTMEYPEPFIENKTQFREVATPSTVEPLKRRNISNIKTHVASAQSQSLFKQSPVETPRSSSREVKDVVHHKQAFDSTIPRDKTWQNRVVQSSSLRQKHHLNQSLKLRNNVHGEKGGPSHFFDIRAQIDIESGRSPPLSPGAFETDFSRQTEKAKKPSKKIHTDSPNKPLSPIAQELESSPTSPNAKSPAWSFKPYQEQTEQKKKPPLPKKEHMISLDQCSPEKAAQYLNNDFNQSYSNTWQYNIVSAVPHSYFNKKYPEKEVLNEAHIQWEMDHEKTYFRSALEKINPQSIKNQVEVEKFRRTNMLMALNTNVMDKTTNDAFSKASNSLKKLPASKIKAFMNDNEEFYMQTHTTAFYQSAAKPNPSPLKLMSMTMPKGFSSPKNGKLNKQEIKDVVRTYFDKQPASLVGQAMPPPPSTVESCHDLIAGAFSSPMK